MTAGRARAWMADDRVVVTVAWAVAWALAAIAGVRFETFDLRFWHLIDRALLEARPLESLWYLHSQPPLFNAAVAAALAVFGDAYGVALYAAFALMSHATVRITASLVRGATGSRAAGLAAALVVLASPSFLAYGHVLFHALPAAFLVMALAWAARRAAEAPGRGRLAAVAAIATAATLLWSAFHPLWLLAVAAWQLWAAPDARRRVALVWLAPLALVGGLMAKNATIAGSPGLSSWTGMNLARLAVQQWPKDAREAAIAAGTLSPVARVRPFAELRWYRDVPDPPPTGVPLLDQPRKSDGDRNLHHLKYAEVSRRYRADALAAIRADPGAYAAAALGGFWRLYLHRATDFHVVEPAVRALGGYATVAGAVLYGPAGPLPELAPERRWSFAATLADGPILRLWFLAALLGGPLWLLRIARAGRLRTPDGASAVALVSALLYVTAVCTLAELGENQRFRFTVEPAAIALCAIGTVTMFRRVTRSRGLWERG